MSMIAAPFIISLSQLPHYDSLQTPEHLASWLQSRVTEGLDWFDHADTEIAGETLLGQAIAQNPGLGERMNVILRMGVVPAQQNSDRFGAKYYDTRPEYLDHALDRSLARMGLTQVHTLMLMRPDPLMDVKATGQALDAIVASGRARHIGVANFLPAQWRHLQSAMSTPIVCQQMEMSIARNQMLFDGMWDSLLQDNMTGMAGSPLWGGRIFENQLGQLLADIAGDYGASAAGIALAWLNTIPGRPVPVVGTLREQRLATLQQDAGITLGRPEWFALLEAVRASRVP